MTYNPDAPKQSGMSEWPITAAVGRDMQSMQPWFIRRSPVLTRLMDTYGDELDTYLGLTTEVIAQLFVRTSTWGLDYWELELGLPYTGELSEAERADRIVAKMRSYRQGTPFVIRLVANAYNLGNVQPVEDFRGRRLIVRFSDIRGVPTNISDMQATLEHLVRASALIEYEYSFMLWQEVMDAAVTWQELKTANITWAQLRTMSPTDLP